MNARFGGVAWALTISTSLPSASSTPAMPSSLPSASQSGRMWLVSRKRSCERTSSMKRGQLIDMQCCCVVSWMNGSVAARRRQLPDAAMPAYRSARTLGMPAGRRRRLFRVERQAGSTPLKRLNVAQSVEKVDLEHLAIQRRAVPADQVHFDLQGSFAERRVRADVDRRRKAPTGRRCCGRRTRPAPGSSVSMASRLAVPKPSFAPRPAPCTTMPRMR